MNKKSKKTLKLILSQLCFVFLLYCASEKFIEAQFIFLKELIRFDDEKKNDTISERRRRKEEEDEEVEDYDQDIFL